MKYQMLYGPKLEKVWGPSEDEPPYDIRVTFMHTGTPFIVLKRKDEDSPWMHDDEYNEGGKIYWTKKLLE